MRIIRLLGNVALWVGACLGIFAGGIWAAGQVGWIQPLIVISGSMEPGIHTGDVLIDRWMPTADLGVGDVTSLPSDLTGKLVTHRVVAVTPTGEGRWDIEMKGDANDEVDLETYTVGDRVLTPAVRIPAAGKVVSKIMEPAVAMPVLLALIALLGLSLLDEEPRKTVRRVIRKVARRDPRVDELDDELAAVGIDVARLQEMNDLDLQLYALGIDVDAEPATPAGTTGNPASVDDRGVEDGSWDFELPPSDGIASPHSGAGSTEQPSRALVRSG